MSIKIHAKTWFRESTDEWINEIEVDSELLDLQQISRITHPNEDEAKKYLKDDVVVVLQSIK